MPGPLLNETELIPERQAGNRSMFILAYHIVAVSILIVFVWAVAYRRGEAAGERRIRRRLGLAPEGELVPVDNTEGGTGTGV